jgi:hypothetical protein
MESYYVTKAGLGFVLGSLLSPPLVLGVELRPLSLIQAPTGAILLIL